MSQTSQPDATRETVRTKYGEIARGASSCCGPTACCGGADADKLAAQLGYDPNDLSQIPPEANLGLSCGNPTAIASLREGEIVLDLGSGAGFDAFVAGPAVGATGRVIGVDMTPDMLNRARRNLAAYRDRTGLDNVEFRLGEIEHLPVADASVDVVISNCVINLSPDKPQVWREIARVLKPGGRVAVSDMALRKPLPEAVRESVEALVGCIAGASLLDEIRAMAAEAGLIAVNVEVKSGNLAAMIDTNDALYHEMLAALPAGATADDYVVSANITATRKAGCCCC